MSKNITRRASLDAFVLTSTILNGALPRPRAAFGGVPVDIASLRAEVGDPTARVAEELPGGRRGSGQRRARRRSSRGADRHRDPRVEQRRRGPTWHVARSGPRRRHRRRRGAAAPRVHQLLSDGRRPGARPTVQPRSRLATRAGLRLLDGAGGLKSPDCRARLAGAKALVAPSKLLINSQSRLPRRSLLLFEDFGDDIDLEHASH